MTAPSGGRAGRGTTGAQTPVQLGGPGKGLGKIGRG